MLQPARRRRRGCEPTSARCSQSRRTSAGACSTGSRSCPTCRLSGSANLGASSRTGGSDRSSRSASGPPWSCAWRPRTRSWAPWRCASRHSSASSRTTARAATWSFFIRRWSCCAAGWRSAPSEEAFQAGFEGHDRHPFAVLVSDLASMVERVAAIEAALAQPDGRGLLALHALAQVPSRATSSLVPLRGVPALADTALPQRELTLPDRRCARSLGDRLRAFSPFASLSDTEATTLAARLARGHVRAGQPIVTRGRPSAGLVLVEDGRAEVRGASGLVTRTLGPGDCCGAASLLTGTDAAGHVVARCPMTVLRLERDTYRRARVRPARRRARPPPRSARRAR